MSKLPRLTGKQVIAALKRSGFAVARIKGSHHLMKHPDGRTTLVPVHSGEHVGPGLLKNILQACEMTADDFVKLL